MMIVTTIIGACPLFIKAAIVSRAFCEHHSDVQDIPRPSYNNLGIGGGKLTDRTLGACWKLLKQSCSRKNRIGCWCMLLNEGISGDKVQQVWDVMYDAALYYRNKVQRPEGINVNSGFILFTVVG